MIKENLIAERIAIDHYRGVDSLLWRPRPWGRAQCLRVYWWSKKSMPNDMILSPGGEKREIMSFACSSSTHQYTSSIVRVQGSRVAQVANQLRDMIDKAIRFGDEISPDHLDRLSAFP